MKTKAWWLPLLVAVLLAAGLSGPRSVVATPSADPTSTVVVRMYYRDQEHLDAVAGELDIWEVHREEKYILAVVPPAQYHWLTSLGYRLEVDAEHTAKLGTKAALDPRYYYFDDYNYNSNGRYLVDWLQDENGAFPNLTELIDAGNAWQADNGGDHHRDMWILRVTNEDTAYGAIEDKPVFFLMASIHAREVATNELAMRYIRYLLEGYNGEGGYGIDPDATWLVNHNVLYVMVMQNPDGRIPDEQDINNYRRKNMDNDDGCSDPDNWGVDLNRNHSFLWGCCGGSSGSPCSETYRGTGRGSEPETAAFQDFFAQVVPDQNGPNGDDEVGETAPDNTKGIFISLHSYADEILWSWYLPGYPDAPNQAQMQVIGRKLAYYNGFSPTGNIGYTVDGSSDYWTYGKFGVPSFTFEVGDDTGACGDFFPAYGCIDGIDGMPRSFWAENKPAFLYAHKIAGEPYMSSYGPDAGDLEASPAGAAPGEPIALTATIADHRYSNDPLQSIAAAEYFVDAPGSDGTGTPMAPADGSWGGTSESAIATLNTAGMSAGQHYVLIHGQNTSGDWGPFSAVFFYVLQPGVSPVIHGYVRDANTNAPLAATVQAGAFHTETDPDTGYYSLMVVAGTYDMTVQSDGYAPATASDVAAGDYQIVEQDFYMYQYCDVFTDDVELGNLGWTSDSPWAITDESSHSPEHSWTDSPGANYSNYLDIRLTSPIFDLSTTAGVSMSFWHTLDLEPGADFGYVEYSTNGGSAWTTAASFSQQDQTTWTQVNLDLPGLSNQASARIRFRLVSNWHSGPWDGWHIDDIVLAGGNSSCLVPMAPEPAFTTNSPVHIGEAMEFTNQTLGTPPLDYLWNFGDGVGTSTEVNPVYLYAFPGTYEVTLTATNSQGASSVMHSVVVLGYEQYLPLVIQGR